MSAQFKPYTGTDEIPSVVHSPLLKFVTVDPALLGTPADARTRLDAGLTDRAPQHDRRRGARSRSTHGTAHQRARITSRILTTDAEFDALRDAWVGLHRRVGGTVFQSFQWQRTWWAHCAAGNPDRLLRIIVFSRGHEVVAIAPLMLETERVLGFVPLRTLRFMATGVSDYLGVLCTPDDAESIAVALARALPQFGAEIVSLRDLISAAEFCIRLTGTLRASRWILDELESEPCPRTCLQGTWAETIQTFPRSVRKRMTNTLNRVERDFEVEYSVVEHEEEFDEVFAWLTTAHQTQWQKRGHGGVFKDPQQAAFFRDVARALLPTGWLYLSQLKLNGRRVAVEYGFQVGDTLQVYQGALDCPKEWERYSPGTFMHLLGMKAMIARGVRIYDFLRGAEPYKYYLGATDHATRHLQFYRPDAPLLRWKMRLRRLQDAARGWLGNTITTVQSRFRSEAADSGSNGAGVDRND